MAELHVYSFDGGEEYWVAESAHEALEMHSVWSGCGCIETGEHEVTQMDDSRSLTICANPDGTIADDSWDRKTRLTLTCCEWALREGKSTSGPLCTVNF